MLHCQNSIVLLAPNFCFISWLIITLLYCLRQPFPVTLVTMANGEKARRGKKFKPSQGFKLVKASFLFETEWITGLLWMERGGLAWTAKAIANNLEWSFKSTNGRTDRKIHACSQGANDSRLVVRISCQVRCLFRSVRRFQVFVADFSFCFLPLLQLLTMLTILPCSSDNIAVTPRMVKGLLSLFDNGVLRQPPNRRYLRHHLREQRHIASGKKTLASASITI